MRGLLTAAVLTIGFATSAQATIVLSTGNPGGTFENVQFNDPGTGGPGGGPMQAPLLGITNMGTSVLFTSNETLVSPSGGQARITGSDGGLRLLDFQLAGGTLFDRAVFNIDIDRRTFNANQSVTITAFDNDMPAQVFTLTQSNLSNGQNFFNLDAIDNQLISRIVITSTADISSIAQIRVGGVAAAVAVPGPIAGAGLPALMALGGLVWARRRKATATA